MGVIANWRQQRAEKEATATVAVLRGRVGRLLELSRVSDAEQVAAEAVRICETVLGPDAVLTLATRTDQVHVLFRTQRLTEAEALARDILRRGEPAPGASGPVADAVAEVRLVLARALARQGRYAEAEREARRLLDSDVFERPEPAELAGEAGQLLARTLGAQGCHREAERELGELAQRLEPGSAGALRARLGRAVELSSLGRQAEAVEEYRAVGRAAIELAGRAGAMLRLSAQHNLAIELIGLGRLPEAEQEARAGMASAARRGPHFGQYAFHFQIVIARLLVERGEYQDALRTVEQALAGRPLATQRIDDEDRVNRVRASALLGLGRSSEAAVLARELLDAERSFFGPAHHSTLDAETLLGRCLTAAGRGAEARELLRANVASWQVYFGDDHAGTLGAEVALFEALSR